MGTRTGLLRAIKILGKINLSKKLGVAYQSMDRWIEKNEMPCTEYNGKTFYSKQIQHLTNGEVTIEELLGFVPPPQSESWPPAKGKASKKKRAA